MTFQVNDGIRLAIQGYPADKGYILGILPNGLYRVVMEERKAGSFHRMNIILYVREDQMTKV